MKNPSYFSPMKSCLNNLWCKFVQRCGMDEYEFISDYDTLIRKFINNNKIIDTTWIIISEDCVELRYKENTDMLIESDYISEIIAAFTTSNAGLGYIKCWIGYTPHRYVIVIRIR